MIAKRILYNIETYNLLLLNYIGARRIKSPKYVAYLLVEYITARHTSATILVVTLVALDATYAYDTTNY